MRHLGVICFIVLTKMFSASRNEFKPLNTFKLGLLEGIFFFTVGDCFYLIWFSLFMKKYFILMIKQILKIMFPTRLKSSMQN